MKVAFINPNLVTLKKDPFTTGIVYMPIGLVYVATRAASSYDIQVIDTFGEAPKKIRVKGSFVFSGLSSAEAMEKIRPGTDAFCLYADRVINHVSLLDFIKTIKNTFPDKPLILLENTQAVTAYSLKAIKEELLASGVDYVLIGEAEERLLQLLDKIATNQTPFDLPGIAFLKKGQLHFTDTTRQKMHPDTLPFPDWSFIPLKNYWALKYAHGPLETGKYLPLLTSRGCPYPCNFCVIPATNNRQWLGRSAKNVVDEMERNWRRFEVREFHVEDVNPTVSDKRTREICHEIIQRKLDVIWKLASGTKVETLKNEETIFLMQRAGCRYISISPESGSSRVMKMIDKSFDFEHSQRMIRAMNRVGIRSQACFVLGFPGEEKADIACTVNSVRELVKAGVDDVTLSIVTPIPGSKIFKGFSGFDSYSYLNFSPTWRKDYPFLNRFRQRLYLKVLLWQLLYHPLKYFQKQLQFLTRRFETKMEMSVYRGIRMKMALMRLKQPVQNKIGRKATHCQNNDKASQIAQ